MTLDPAAKLLLVVLIAFALIGLYLAGRMRL